MSVKLENGYYSSRKWLFILIYQLIINIYCHSLIYWRDLPDIKESTSWASNRFSCTSYEIPNIKVSQVPNNFCST